MLMQGTHMPVKPNAAKGFLHSGGYNGTWFYRQGVMHHAKVRHEAVQITVKRSLFLSDLISCSIMGSLPAHESMATLRYEAAGKRFPDR